MVEKRMTAEAVIEAARKLESIKRLDQEIESVVFGMINAPAGVLGSKLRDVIGRNAVMSLCDVSLFGVCLRAVALALLEKRTAMAAEVEGFITVPPPPYTVRSIPGGPQDG